jgi:hypothetical protein
LGLHTGRRASAGEQTVAEAIRNFLRQHLPGVFVSPPKPPGPPDYVGDYIADYSLPTQDEINADDPALVDLYSKSKVISAKRES